MYSFSFIKLDLLRILLVLLVLALGFTLSCIYKYKLAPWLERILAKTKHQYDSILVNGFKMPMVVFLSVCGIYTALLALPSAIGAAPTGGYFTTIAQLMRITIVVLIIWGLVSSGDIASVFLQSMQNKLDIRANQTMARFLSYIFKTIVLALGTVIVISELGYDVNGLIAGLGLGGLTVALAAKDTAGNFFGGVIIIFEKPFEIGDWISTANCEGVVEDITFRSTKLRTFSNALTIIPNAELSSGAITNWTRMKMRKAALNLALPVETSAEQISRLLNMIRDMLVNNSQIVEDTVQVRFADFGRGFLNISVTYFTATTEFGQYLDIKDDVNLQVLRVLDECGIKPVLPMESIRA